MTAPTQDLSRCDGSLYHITPDGYVYRCRQVRTRRGWKIIIGAGFIVSVMFLVAGLAGACYLVANGVGYVLTHAWWAR